MPISLLVSLEVVKFFQARFIVWDYTIFDENTGMETKVQSSNLNEELGQVKYIFSDKTGTLTQNVMEFRKFSAGSKSYGEVDGDKFDRMLLTQYQPSSQKGDLLRKDLVPNVNFDCPKFWGDYQDQSSDNY